MDLRDRLKKTTFLCKIISLVLRVLGEKTALKSFKIDGLQLQKRAFDAFLKLLQSNRELKEIGLVNIGLTATSRVISVRFDAELSVGKSVFGGV